MGEILEARRNQTAKRFDRLKRSLQATEKRIAQSACVYATGSFGRGEASRHSDLDLFIVGRSERDQPELSNLEAICVKADLIRTTQNMGFPEFSGDGEYLKHYTHRDLIDSLGKRHDDAVNTFTARLLLLLESQPLIGSSVHEKVITDVVEAYWRDYSKHTDEFSPAFLANDILRLWRTLCVNYEAGTSSEPKEKRAKRKLKNYKLKHSRLVTCYSALLHLLATFVSEGTVRPHDAIDMTRLSPTARLEWVLKRPIPTEARQKIGGLLDHYEKFLAATDYRESELITLFLDPQKSKEYLHSASTLGDLTFQALDIIGRGSSFYRVLVV